MEINPIKSIMGASPHTGRATRVGITKIAFCSLEDGLLCVRIDDNVAVRAANFDHADIVVGTRRCTGRTADTGVIIDNNTATDLTAVNGAGGTADHADRIRAMHTGIGHHPVVKCFAVTHKTRVAAVC